MKKFLKIGCGGFIALFILLIIIGMFVGDDNKETTDKEKEPVTASTNTDSKMINQMLGRTKRLV